MSINFGVPGITPLASSWEVSALKSSRTACPWETGFLDAFDFSADFIRVLSPFSRQQQSWDSHSGFYSDSGGGISSGDSAQFHLGHDDPLANRDYNASSIAIHQSLPLFDHSVIRRGLWHCKLEGSITSGRALFYPLFISKDGADYDTASYTYIIPKPNPLDTDLAAYITFDWILNRRCLGYNVACNNSFVSQFVDSSFRFRGYRHGTTANW